MPTLFTAPLETLTPGDVQALMGWPESLTAEFKREVPGREGRPDAWTTGGKIEDYGRTRLFKEIVALANAAGGHLVIGVDEDSTASPPTASAITPVPRCAELAERLIQMAQSIDPPIPLLIARGITTDGEAGVVVVRVPASRSAPHRSTDREVYVRRGTASVPVSMREVREMVISAERRDNAYDQQFHTAAVEFRDWLETPFANELTSNKSIAGFRITAVPASSALSLPRLFGRFDHNRFREQFFLTKDEGHPFRVDALRVPQLFRPIIRGVHSVYEYNCNPAYLEVLESGFVTFGWRTGPRSLQSPCQIHLIRILPHILNILHVVNGLRSEGGVPEHEYGIEVELHVAHHGSMLLGLWGVGYDDDLETLSGSELPVIFPRLSYGPVSDTDAVISTFATDFSDAGGSRRKSGIMLRSVHPGTSFR